MCNILAFLVDTKLSGKIPFHPKAILTIIINSK